MTTSNVAAMLSRGLLMGPPEPTTAAALDAVSWSFAALLAVAAVGALFLLRYVLDRGIFQACILPAADCCS